MEKKEREKTVARPRKNLPIEEEIERQEAAVEKSKAKYDADVKKLKDLLAKQDEIKKKELMDAVEKSGRTYEEIIAFLRADKGEGE